RQARGQRAEELLDRRRTAGGGRDPEEAEGEPRILAAIDRGLGLAGAGDLGGRLGRPRRPGEPGQADDLEATDEGDLRPQILRDLPELGADLPPRLGDEVE